MRMHGPEAVEGRLTRAATAKQSSRPMPMRVMRLALRRRMTARTEAGTGMTMAAQTLGTKLAMLGIGGDDGKRYDGDMMSREIRGEKKRGGGEGAVRLNSIEGRQTTGREAHLHCCVSPPRDSRAPRSVAASTRDWRRRVRADRSGRLACWAESEAC